jgi:hypothetical protein
MRLSPTMRELPAKDAAAFVRAGLASLPASHTVEALVHAPAATVRTAVGQWARIEEVDEQRCRLHMTVDNLDWPTLALGRRRYGMELLRSGKRLSVSGEHERSTVRRRPAAS